MATHSSILAQRICKADLSNLVSTLRLIVAKGLAYLSEAMSHAMQGHARLAGHDGELRKKHGLLDEGMANHFCVLATKTP